MGSESPMMWRMRSHVLVVWSLAIVVSAFLGLTGYFLLRDMSWQTRPDLAAAVFGLGLALLGASVAGGLWFWAVRVALASRRYGNAELELASGPIRIGARLQGRIRAQASLASDQAMNLVLQCWGKRGGGGDSGGESWLRWDSETLLTEAQVVQTRGELLLYVDLEIPATQPPTGLAEKGWDIRWNLSMKLEPDTGYKPTFDIPVESSASVSTEAGESVMASGQSSINIRHRTVANLHCTPRDDPPRARPPHARVRVERPDSVGIQIIPQKSTASAFLFGWCLLTLPLWVVFPIWGLAELRGVASPPIIAYAIQLGVALGAAFFFNGLPLLGVAFVNQSFRLSPDGVSAKRLWRRKQFPAGHFTVCEAVGNSHDTWMVSLERSENSVSGGLVMAIVSTEAEAQWLLDEIHRALREGTSRSGPLST